MIKNRVIIAPSERKVLEKMARSRRGRADEARRAELILRLGAGETYDQIQEGLGCNRSFISMWKERFQADRIAGLKGRHKGAAVTVLTPTLRARILSKTKEKPPGATTHWSTRRLAAALGLPNHMLVQRTWEDAGLKPHRLERYMTSNDPDFEAKAADVIGLYLNPPQHAAVFCVDEKTAIQALDRLVPVLPLSPGRAERHGFEYFRHGTLSLYAALNTKTGEVIGKTAARHTSDEFVDFLQQVVGSQPNGKEVHIIADNLSAHKTKKVAAFLEKNPSVKIHYTPTYSSWLNQVEIWFSRIERQVIERGIFKSVRDLSNKLMRFIRHYNKTAKPIRWSYSDPTKRIKPDPETNVTRH